MKISYIVVKNGIFGKSWENLGKLERSTVLYILQKKKIQIKKNAQTCTKLGNPENPVKPVVNKKMTDFFKECMLCQNKNLPNIDENQQNPDKVLSVPSFGRLLKKSCYRQPCNQDLSYTHLVRARYFWLFSLRYFDF